jgi:formylglycine-generating enzyme required for sulfatase activity
MPSCHSQSLGRFVLSAFAGTFAIAVLAAAPETKPDTVNLDLGQGVSLSLARLPAGKFLMGSPKGDMGAANDESDRAPNNPAQHEVTLSKPFLIGVTEITQEQYQQVTGTNPSHFKGADLPVDSVSWEDATRFCKMLSDKTGKVVRIPTEAEWEYACRAGSTTRYFHGDDPDSEELADHAWYEVNAGRKTHPVGLKKPNAWGLCDMGGNLWEWCQDFYAGPYEDKSVTDPKGPAAGGIRILRGGCWETGRLSCRSTNRGGMIPGRATSRFGFRVVVEE